MGVEPDPGRRARLGTAAIMAGAAVLLVVVGAAHLVWGNTGAAVLGWLALGWSAGGLAAALVPGVRARRR